MGSIITNNLSGIVPKIKPKWQRFACNDSRFMLEACPVNHNIFGKLDVSVKKCEDGFGRYVIELKNRLNKILGKETISIEDYDNYSYNL